ncbi:MAG: sigma-70 family RNA polymerase sigma factor [Christensenella sp.]|nr:sigma-70 family RNA polymerase sigma factor [Christensenella sp.]
MKNNQSTYSRLLSVFSANNEQRIRECLSKNDIDEKNKIVEEHLFLVAYLARGMSGRIGNVEDLASVGSIGLIKAVYSFDLSQNVRFVTYASVCIKNEMLVYLRNNIHSASEVSFEEKFLTESEDGALCFSKAMEGGDEAWDYVERKETCKMIEKILGELTARQREIMDLRFGFSDKIERTQKEVARKIGVTQSYISKVERKVMCIMRKKIELRQNMWK